MRGVTRERLSRRSYPIVARALKYRVVCLRVLPCTDGLPYKGYPIAIPVTSLPGKPYRKGYPRGVARGRYETRSGR